MRLSHLVLYVFLSAPASVQGAEQRFCVLAEDAIGNVRVFIPDDQSTSTLKIDVESEFCEKSCSSICAAVDFNSELCGGELEQRLTPFDDFRSRVFCENQKSTTAVSNITARVAKSYPLGMQGADAVIDAANRLLEANQCPLTLKSDAPVQNLPPAFDTLTISDAVQLRRLGHFPGKIKFVRQIDYCERPQATFSLDRDGKELIWACAIPSYGSAVISHQSLENSAILLLRTYAQLAEVGFEPSDIALTLLDKDMFIPVSPLLEGKMQQFHISKAQCVQLIRYAKRDGEMHRVR
ncbi:hypothetical protein [Bradyrhizobium sp. 6(2017)]|uniref:hypothetical protein n=1 Tax=Bradyrhizobium sp. 6(2017) TaxID=1197460 RepID=UPI0013E14057|nr:hypothetical protein [Bradyrhizobium sp. 6(2017)]QIG97164.1 hypothetical protein G6P99_35410 [Bradyrhizobium sp. 6(2017)]